MPVDKARSRCLSGVVGLLGLLSLTGSAEAGLRISALDPAAAAAAERCIGRFLSDGPSVRQVVEDLQNSSEDHVISAIPGIGAGGNAASAHSPADATSASSGGTGNGSGSTVTWDPTAGNLPWEAGLPNAPNDPCFFLIHELRHSHAFDRGTRVPPPPPPPIPLTLVGGPPAPDPPIGTHFDQEFRACQLENRYRQHTGYRIRQSYGPLTIGGVVVANIVVPTWAQ